MKIEDKFRYPSLNGLRAISILLVIVHHLSIQGVLDHWFQYKWLLPIVLFVQDGHLGVNIFFVISGFLITSLMLLEEKKDGKISIKNFYIRRVLRIFPAYYFFLFVLLILQLFNIIYISNLSWLTAFTYTKYLNPTLDWYTAHAWSLSIEEQFYLFWPLIFVLGNSITKKVCILIVIITPLIRLYTHIFPISWIHELSIFTRVDAIATGCIIALYKDELIELLRNNFRIKFFASAICLFIIRFLPVIFEKLHFDLNFIFISLGVTHGTLANLFISIILLYSIYGNKGLWYRLLNSKLFNIIGTFSYGIYLWQQLFINDRGYWFTLFPQNLIFIFVTVLFSYYFLEKPFLKLKDKFRKV